MPGTVAKIANEYFLQKKRKKKQFPRMSSQKN